MFSDTGGALSQSDILVDELEMGDLDINFSLFPNQEITFVWQAPPGMHFQVEAPAGFSQVTLEFVYQLDGASNLPSFFSPTALRVKEHLGGAPRNGFSQCRFSSGGGRQASVSAFLFFTPGETATFKSVEATFVIPPSFMENYSEVPELQIGILGLAQEDVSYVGGGALSDPGRWFTLVDEPEINRAPARKKASLKRQAKKIKRSIQKVKRKNDRRQLGKLIRQLKRTNRAIGRIQLPPRPGTVNMPITPI